MDGSREFPVDPHSQGDMQFERCPNREMRIVESVSARQNANDCPALGGDCPTPYIDWPHKELAVVASRNPVAVEVSLPRRIRIEEADMYTQLKRLKFARLNSFAVCARGAVGNDE